MTRRRDKEATQREIIDAASELFAEKGFADTSLTEIADKAGVTKSLIHHHFGAKEQLWKEVACSIFGEYEVVQKKMIDEGPDTVETFIASVRMYADFLESHPQIARMHGWMSLENLPHSQAKTLTELGVQKLTRAIENGDVRADVAPIYMLLSFIFLIDHWVLSRKIVAQWLPEGVDLDTVANGYVDAMTKILVDGIRARTTSDAS